MTSAPEEASAEDAPAAAKPNAIAVTLVHGIDALIGTLQGLRLRLGAPVTGGEGDDEEGDGRRSRPHAKHAEGEAPAPETKGLPPRLRMAFLACLALVLGGLFGAYFAHGLFAEKLDVQAVRLAEQTERLVVVEPENERVKKAEAACLTTLTETQKKLGETQRSLAKATSWRMSKCDENDTACLAKYAPTASGAAPSVAPRRSAAERAAAERAAASQQSGTCDISSSNPQESLARCLGAYNR